jgi:hypothetical protein
MTFVSRMSMACLWELGPRDFPVSRGEGEASTIHRSRRGARPTPTPTLPEVAAGQAGRSEKVLRSSFPLLFEGAWLKYALRLFVEKARTSL